MMNDTATFRHWLSRFPAFLILTGVCIHLQAQVLIPPAADPGAIQNRELEREKRQRIEELRRERIEQPMQPATPLATPAPAPSGEGTQFKVREIHFEPASEILSVQELEALITDFRGRSLRLSQLRELIGRINELYQAKGVITARASLPSQDVTDGIIRIQLIEGRVGHIGIDGNASTRVAYIADRLTLKPGSLVDLPILESDLRRFNRSNDAQLRAELKPGHELGRTDIGITIAEPKRDDFRLFSDNSGSSATGTQRFGAAYTRRSLTGRRDDLYISVVRSEGNLGNSLAYSLPVSRLGTRVSLGYFRDSTKIISGPIAALDITGQATSWALSMRHPFEVSTSLQLDGLATWKQRRTINWISSTELTAAELDGGTIGLDAQVLDSNGFWNVTAELGAGVNRPDGAIASDYTVARGAVRRSVAVGSELTFNGTFNWQLAEHKLLPAGEQIQLGGDGSVRGYEPGVFSGDKGWVVNLEVQRRLNLPGDSSWTGAMLAFADHGEVKPYRPPNNPRGVDAITSVGVGVSLILRDQLQARFVVGKPVNPSYDVGSRTRVHFQIFWSL